MKAHSFSFILIGTTCSASPTPNDFVTQRPKPKLVGSIGSPALRRLTGASLPPRLLAGKSVALVKNVTSRETGDSNVVKRIDLLATGVTPPEIFGGH